MTIPKLNFPFRIYKTLYYRYNFKKYQIDIAYEVEEFSLQDCITYSEQYGVSKPEIEAVYEDNEDITVSFQKKEDLELWQEIMATIKRYMENDSLTYALLYIDETFRNWKFGGGL